MRPIRTVGLRPPTSAAQAGPEVLEDLRDARGRRPQRPGEAPSRPAEPVWVPRAHQAGARWGRRPRPPTPTSQLIHPPASAPPASSGNPPAMTSRGAPASRPRPPGAKRFPRRSWPTAHAPRLRPETSGFTGRAGLSCRGVPCHHHPGEGSGFAPRSGARTLSSRAPLQAWGLGPGACSRGPAPWAFRGEGGMCPIPCPSRLLSFPRDPLLSLREARPWGRPLHPLGRRRVVAERPWLWCCLVAAWPGVARLEGGRPRCCPGQA